MFRFVVRPVVKRNFRKGVYGPRYERYFENINPNHYREWMGCVKEKPSRIALMAGNQLTRKDIDTYLDLEKDFKVDKIVEHIIECSNKGREVDALLWCFTQKLKKVEDFSLVHQQDRERSIKTLRWHILENWEKFDVYISSPSFKILF